MLELEAKNEMQRESSLVGRPLAIGTSSLSSSSSYLWPLAFGSSIAAYCSLFWNEVDYRTTGGGKQDGQSTRLKVRQDVVDPI
jgi:hypothetical protein